MMALVEAGQTRHFIVKFDDTIGVPSKTVAQNVLGLCEADYYRTTALIPSHRGLGGDPFIDNNRIEVLIINDPSGIVYKPPGPGFGGADNIAHNLGGPPARIRINPFSSAGVTITDDYAGFVLVAELAELIMVWYNWDAASSQGEGLSRVMAEELHPQSSSNWVNLWLNRRPREDDISKNMGTEPNSLFGRGDQNQLAYGCAMIFIYFLRYQLGYTYEQILLARGPLLSDRYKDLTGSGDDPADRVNKLLDDHLGTGAINLPTNNPFPLYDGDARRVSFAFGKTDFGNFFLLPEMGTAHVRPFFNCPAADYPYNTWGHYVTRPIIASTLGIGLPRFNWHINGKPLFADSHSDAVSAKVSVPDPQNPGSSHDMTENFSFDYKIETFGTTSTLTITSRSLHGDYQLDVKVEADESGKPTVPVAAQTTTGFLTRAITYGGNYGSDREKCAKTVQKAIADRVRIQVNFDLLRTLPDPPPPDSLGIILEAVSHIQEELTDLNVSNHAVASEIARYMANELKVAPRVFLRGIKGESNTAQ
jgi:hypothetical protein